MQVSKINYQNTPKFKAGLYFSKVSNVIFNKEANYITNKPVKVSSDGFKYIEDTELPEEMKKRFANIPFIYDLAQKFDTFIWTSFSRDSICGKNAVVTKVSWGDSSQKYAPQKYVVTHSEKSKEDSINKMFENLEKGIFLKD